MQIRGTVVSVEIDIQVPKNGGGTYPGARLAYRDDSGKMCEQAFHNNAFKFNKTLKDSLESLKPNDDIVIDKEKKGDYWNVLSIVKADGTGPIPQASTATKPTASPKNTYETADERAKKQVYIVRQSSITNAIALKGQKATIEDILNTAKEFEQFVFRTDAVQDLVNMDDDIPQ